VKIRLFCLLGFLCSWPLVTLAQPEKLATGSVAGRITYKDQPLPGVIVTLDSARPGPNQPQNPISAKTGSDGRYRLTGIAAGTYLVSPRAMAYALPIDGSSWRPGKNINISDGEAIDDFDFALVKGGVITGTITDANGRPVIGQSVHLTRGDAAGVFRNFTSGNYRMYNTDDRGAYRLFGLPAGRYKVSLGDGRDTLVMGRAGGYYQLTYYPGVTNEAEAKIVEVTEGSETTEIDFRVNKPEKTYEAKGRLIDGSTGTPLAGFNMARGMMSKEWESFSGYGWTQDLTDANGEFIMRSLSPGRYAAFPVSTTSTEYFSDPTVFEVTNSDVEGLEVKAYRGASISGTVVIEGSNDPALLKSLPQFYVTASGERTTLQAPSRPAPIMPDGSFRLSGLRPGKMRLYVPPANNEMPLTLARIEREGALLPDGIELTSGEQVKGVKLVMIYSSAVLRGQVSVVGGALSPDTRLVLWANQQGTTINRSTQVDPRGRFILSNLAPGEYKLSLSQSVVSGTSTTHTRPVVMQTVMVGAGETTVTLTLDLSAKKEGQQ
jgi:protocatechuate 3,4-dioxygenase beta subunit